MVPQGFSPLNTSPAHNLWKKWRNPSSRKWFRNTWWSVCSDSQHINNKIVKRPIECQDSFYTIVQAQVPRNICFLSLSQLHAKLIHNNPYCLKTVLRLHRCGQHIIIIIISIIITYVSVEDCIDANIICSLFPLDCTVWIYTLWMICMFNTVLYKQVP